MELRVNGDVRQKGNTNEMVVTLPHLISYHSPQTFSAGDLITTGTIRGVAAIQENPFDFYLKPGDVVEAEITGVGHPPQQGHQLGGALRRARAEAGRLVRIANLAGRAVLVSEGGAVDVATASDGRFGPDPAGAVRRLGRLRGVGIDGSGCRGRGIRRLRRHRARRPGARARARSSRSA